MSDNDLPEWAVKMTDDEWSALEKEHNSYTRCSTCGKRLILTLCHHGESAYYCVEHCPAHKWQSDYDWETECGRCGIPYDRYLQRLLDKNGVVYSKP